MECPICRGKGKVPVRGGGEAPCPLCGGPGKLAVKTQPKGSAFAAHRWEQASRLGRLTGPQFALFGVVLLVAAAAAASDLIYFFSRITSLTEHACHAVFWAAMYAAGKGLSLHRHSGTRWAGLVFLLLALAARFYLSAGVGDTLEPAPPPAPPAAPAPPGPARRLRPSLTSPPRPAIKARHAARDAEIQDPGPADHRARPALRGQHHPGRRPA